MTRRSLAYASVIIVVAMLALAAALGSGLPGDAQLPIHWNIHGEPDRFASKWQALLLPAGFTAFISLLFFLLPVLEPRRQGIARSQGLYHATWVGVLIIGAAGQVATLSAVLGWGISPVDLVMVAVGAMMVLIGNQLGKSRSMYMLGIRTPWTLASEEVWIKTHRLGGKLMVAAGLFVALMAALPVSTETNGLIVGLAIATAALVPIVYSYVQWRREKTSEAR